MKNHKRNVRLTAKDYNFKMMKCLTASDYATSGIREIFDLWEEMRKSKCLPNVITYNFMIKACFISEYRAEDGFKLFEMMKEQKIPPTLVSFNETIKCCAKTQSVQRALSYVKEMQAMGLKPDMITHHFMIVTFAKSGVFKMAEEYIQNMIESNELPTMDMYNELVTEACKLNMSLLGCYYLQECMDQKFDIPGALCEQVLESCIVRENDSGAVIIFAKVLPRCKLYLGWNGKSGPLHLDLGTHLAVLNMAARTANMRLAQLCDKSLKECGYERNQDYFDALFQTMVRAENIKKSFGVLVAAEKEGVQVSMEARELLIDHLAVIGQELLPSIRLWLKAQRQRQQKLTSVCGINCLMATYTQMGRDQDVAKILSEWDQYCEASPNTETFNFVLESQLAGHTADTFQDKEKEILRVMKQSSILPDAGSLEAMVRKRVTLGLWKRAIALYDTMKQLQFEPSQFFSEFLVRQAALANDVDSALRFANDLIDGPCYTPDDIAAMAKVVPTIKHYDMACSELRERVMVGDQL